MRHLILSLALFALPSGAEASATRCRLEQGVLVAAAEVGGIAGDYIIDTGEAASILAETQAQDAGFDGEQAVAEVRFAGQQLAARHLQVRDLDVRTHTFTTPIAGVIGADLLADFVVDIRFQPCWIALWRKGSEPRFRPRLTLPVFWILQAPTIPASIADGPTALTGPFVVSTGLGRPVRLDAAMASIPGGGDHGALRALSFGGRLFENIDAVLQPEGETLGAVGAPVLSRFRMRLDMPGQSLQLTPAP